MLKFVILSLSLVLSGCYTTITKDQVTLGNKFCEDKGGVSHIVVYDLINNYVRCANGAAAFLEGRGRGQEI